MTSTEIKNDFIESKKNISCVIESINHVLINFYTEVEKIKENPILLNIFEMLPMVDIKNASKSLEMNLKIILRNKMKCSVFGKTSNGKSAVINAILNEKLLPSSIGRTTSCFIKVEGCDDDVGYYLDKDGKRCNLEDINTIANEFTDEKYEINSEIALFWPKTKCSLLQNEVQFLDSPGVDFSNEHEKCIQSHCQDSDVFVYVVDSCSTINESEKVFFRSVKSLISNPNIFILMNKWDKCENELSATKLEKVKRQHVVTIKRFFQDDLKMDCDFEQRTFFIAAKELFEECTTPERTRRQEEFARFVKSMQIVMSQKALMTKFKPHLIRGNECLQSIINTIDIIINTKEANSPESYDEQELMSKLFSLQQSRFDEINRILEETIDMYSQELVFFIIENIKDLTRLENTVNDLVNRVMENINKVLSCSTLGLLNEIKATLKSISKWKSTINIFDEYFPSAEDSNLSEKPGTERLEHTEKRTDNSCQNNIVSIMSIVIPLNIELGFILSTEKISKLEEKKRMFGENKFNPKKLCRRISDILMKLFNKLLEEKQNNIRKITNILIKKFLIDHTEYCQFITVMEQLRNKCCTIVNDTKRENEKISES